MHIAIIGSGISGLTAAYLLNKKHPEHRFTLFEARSRIGGHTHTVEVQENDRSLWVDTGFIIYNHRTYPLFSALLCELGVQGQKTNMGFSVKDQITGLEYSGENLSALFAQKKNLWNPRFYRMLAEILRFHKRAPGLLNDDQGKITLGDYLKAEKYSDYFINKFILPMGSAIWSTPCNEMLQFPAQFFVRFFAQHGLLSVFDQPQWYTIQGGSHRYIEVLIKNFQDAIQLNSPVKQVVRKADSVEIQIGNSTDKTSHHAYFDAVIFACHSDQALALLGDASQIETDILTALPYQKNKVVLHRWQNILPQNRKAWASWNYHILPKYEDQACVTYNMNLLQNLEAEKTYCVSLNYPERIPKQDIIGEYTYSHPVFSLKGLQAQQQFDRINGQNKTYFCGAYWRNGFHEDGVWSAHRVVQSLVESRVLI